MGNDSIDLFVDNKHCTSFSCSPGNEVALAIGYLVITQFISDASQIQSASFNQGKIKISLGDEKTFKEQYDAKMVSGDYDWSPKISEVKKSDIDNLVNILSEQPSEDGNHRVFLMDTMTKESVMGIDASLEYALYKAVGLASKRNIDFQSSMLLFQNAIEPEHLEMCRKIPIYVIATMENFSDISRNIASQKSLDQTVIEMDDGDPVVVMEGTVMYLDDLLQHEFVDVTPNERIYELSDFKVPIIIEGVSDIMFRTIASGTFYDLELMPDSKNTFRFEPAPDIHYRGLPIREVYSEPYRTLLYLEKTISISISWSGQGDKLVVEPKH